MNSERVQRVFWDDVRNHFMSVNPVFCKEVDKLSPDEKYPLYIMHYNYGDLIGDDESIFVPKNNTEYFRLGDAETPAQMIKDIGYGIQSSPLGMFYNKSFEWFLVATEDQNHITFPVFIDEPGVFFGIGQVTNFGHKETHMPNGVLFVVAGSKSNFMLPQIGCGTYHSRIQKQYGITKAAPKSYYEHATIFTDIVKSRKLTNNWTASVIYFSEPWVKSISEDYAWKEVKDYFYRVSNTRSEYAVNSDYYNHIYRVANKRNNLKKNLLLYDTARYLFEILLGAKLGFAPAENDDMLPLEIIQEAYSECYTLPYDPIIMIPATMDAINPKTVYYSLQHPALCSYSPKARNASTVLTDIFELVDVIEKYKKDFSLPIRECRNTVLEQVANQSNFKFYHSSIQENNIIDNPNKILAADNRFQILDKDFPADAKFFKGCIAMDLIK